MSFQENLKYYREKAGYKTAKELADILNLPYNTYAGYESKGREPKYQMLCKIADLLHVSTDELLGRKNNILGMNEDEQLKKEIKEALAQHEEPIKLEPVNLQDKKTDFISFNIYTNDNKFLYVKSSEYLSALIEKSKKIGIGWNETLYNISIELKYNDSDKQKVFYPLIGNLGNNNNPYLQITTIVDRFAEKFNSKAYFNNYPALIEKKSINNNDLEKLEEFKKFWSDLDVAIVGLSSRRESYQSYISDIPKVDKLNVDEIEGIILGSFFMNNGESKLMKTSRRFNRNLAVKRSIHLTENIQCMMLQKQFQTENIL